MSYDEAKRYLLDRARERGVDAEILATETRELTLEAFDGILSQTTQATQGGIGLRVVADGGVGYAWTEDLDRDALDWTLDEAIENAGLAADRDGFLPPGEALGRKDLLSEGLSAPVDEKARRAIDLEASLRDDPRVRQLWLSRYSEREAQASLASTRGAEGSYRNGYAMLLGSIIMGEGDDIKQALDYELSKEVHTLDPTVTAQTMLSSTGRLLGARPLATGRYRAYLEPKVVAALVGLLAYALSGKTLIEGKSRFQDTLGKRVASELVTLVDDPTLDGGLASRPFDSEGTPAARTPLIEAGVLKSFLHNSYTARRAEQANTGHAQRSYKGTLGVAPSNLVLEPGAGVVPVDGVVVTEVMGLHAGANPISGDLSLQGFGLLYRGGERAHPVDNFAFSGNLFELLERVVAVGDDPSWHAQPTVVRAPTVELESLSFAGT